jgi:hypothetical protein
MDIDDYDDGGAAFGFARAGAADDAAAAGAADDGAPPPLSTFSAAAPPFFAATLHDDNDITPGDPHALASAALIAGQQLGPEALAAADRAHPLEDRLALVLSALMADESPSADAVAAFADASSGRDAAAQLHRAATHLHLRRAADDHEAQAATWRLLGHLYCAGDAPAGLGGARAPGCGGRRTLRQLLREVVNGDPGLARLAHVVAWLEAQAAARLDAASAGGVGGGIGLGDGANGGGNGNEFAPGEGVWRETALGSRPARAGAGTAAALPPGAAAAATAAIEAAAGEIGGGAAAAAAAAAAGTSSSPSAAAATTTTANAALALPPTTASTLPLPAPELDPDGPTRGASVLAPGDEAAEERLAALLWRLVRAGRLADARRACRQCGQPWRAAALAGAGGDYGPLPVGAAAAEADLALDEDAAAEELAGEVDGGVVAGRALWKWACVSAADAAAEAASLSSAAAGGGASGSGGPVGGNSGRRFEAALYGALGGHVARMLPVCAGSWEDECWAYCRAWLDLAADAELARCFASLRAARQQQRQQRGKKAGGVVDLDIQDMEDDDDLALSGDNALEFLLLGNGGDSGAAATMTAAGGPGGDAALALDPSLAAAALPSLAPGYTRFVRPGAPLEAAEVLRGGWPLARLRRSGGRVLVPGSFEELGALLASATAAGAGGGGGGGGGIGGEGLNSSASGPPAAVAQHRRLQLALIAEQWDGLVVGAARWALEQQPPAAAANNSNTALPPSSASSSSLLLPRDPADPAFAALAFAAHFALALRALGLVPDPARAAAAAQAAAADAAEGGAASAEGDAAEAEAARLQQVLSRVLEAYALALASRRETRGLAPLYACHLRRRARLAVIGRVVDEATRQGAGSGDGRGGGGDGNDGPDDAECRALHAAMAGAFEGWYRRQAALDFFLDQGEPLAEAGVPSADVPGWGGGGGEEGDEEDEDEDDDDQAAAAEQGRARRPRLRPPRRPPTYLPSNYLYGDLRAEEARLLMSELVRGGGGGGGWSADGSGGEQQQPPELARVRRARWLFYAFLDARDRAAEAGLPFPRWEGSFGDALAHAVELAAELALGPAAGLRGRGGGGVGGGSSAPAPAAAALRALVLEAVPDGFGAAVSAAARQGLPDAAAGVVERRLAALAFLQRYAALDARYRASRERLAAVGGPATTGAGARRGRGGQQQQPQQPPASLDPAAAVEAEELVCDLLELAGADELSPLVSPGEDEASEAPTSLRLLVAAPSAATSARGRQDGGSNASAKLRTAVADALVRVLQDADGVTARVLLPEDAAAEDFARAGDGGGGAGGGAAPDKGGGAGGALLLRAAAAAAARDSSAPAVVVVEFASRVEDLGRPDLPADEYARRAARMLASWRGMCRAAAWLVSGARAAAAASAGGGGGSASDAAVSSSPPAPSSPAPLPRLALLSMSASLSTSLQLLRHRAADKLLTRAAKLLRALALAPQGAAGEAEAPSAAALLSALVELAADAGGPCEAEVIAAAAAAGGGATAEARPALLPLLSREAAARLLSLVADAVEAAPPSAAGAL